MSSHNIHDILVSQVQNNLLSDGENVIPKSIKHKYFEVFKNSRFPTKKHEDYKYTKLSEDDFRNLDFQHNKTNTQSFSDTLTRFFTLFPYKITFINGTLSSDFTSLPSGMSFKKHIGENELQDLDKLIDKKNYFGLQNFIASPDIHYLKVQNDQKVNDTIGIFHITTTSFENNISLPCLYMEAGENSYSNFFEVYFHEGPSSSKYVTNSSLYINIDKGGVIDINKLQVETDNSSHIATMGANLKENSVLNTQLMTLGGKNSRDNIKVTLSEKNARANLYGLYDLDYSKQADNFLEINHNAEETFSHQLFKGILKDESHGVFTGKVNITKDAKHSASSQLNKNLILDKKSQITTRPQLLIDTDDVKCTHGATTGEMDKDQIFYLKTRGIKESKAKRMLYHAFAREVIEASPCGKVKQILNNFFLNHAKNELVISDNSERCHHGIFNFK